MPDVVPAPIRALCPGCGLVEGVFPCPRCGTTAPTRHDPQPAESTASAVLFLGAALFAVSGLFLFLVPAPWGLVLGLSLGAIGTGMSGLSAWALRDPPRPWRVVAPGAVGIGVVQKGVLLYSYGERSRTEPVDPAEHQALLGVQRDDLKAAVRARVDAPEKAAAAFPALWLLARVARGEARAEEHTVVRWADGVDQPPEIEVRELLPPPDPEEVAPYEPTDAAEALAAWIDTHSALWAAFTHL